MPKSTKKNPARVRPTVKAMAELQAAHDTAARQIANLMAHMKTLRSMADSDSSHLQSQRLDAHIARGLLSEVLLSAIELPDGLRERVEKFVSVGASRLGYAARHFAQMDAPKGTAQIGIKEIAQVTGVPASMIASPKSGN